MEKRTGRTCEGSRFFFRFFSFLFFFFDRDRNSERKKGFLLRKGEKENGHGPIPVAFEPCRWWKNRYLLATRIGPNYSSKETKQAVSIEPSVRRISVTVHLRKYIEKLLREIRGKHLNVRAKRDIRASSMVPRPDDGGGTGGFDDRRCRRR